MFTALRESLEQQGVCVFTRGRLGSETVRGHFVPPQDGDDCAGRIEIFREREDVLEDAMQELATLAHEAGHRETFRLVLRPKNYAAAADKLTAENFDDLSATERAILWDEEVRAWEHGEGLLRQLGFNDWDEYRHCAQEGLETYQRKLELPGEVLAAVRLLSV